MKPILSQSFEMTSIGNGLQDIYHRPQNLAPMYLMSVACRLLVGILFFGTNGGKTRQFETLKAFFINLMPAMEWRWHKKLWAIKALAYGVFSAFSKQKVVYLRVEVFSYSARASRAGTIRG